LAGRQLPGKPNVIFVLTDDQGYGDLGCTGNPIIQTPHIDAFSRVSTRFTNFHVGTTCAPTRAGLMTGHHANSTGVWHTLGGRSLLRRDERTLPEVLKEHGYRTAIFGKWHLGDTYPYRPQDRGFETSVVHGGGGIGQTPDFWGNDYIDDVYLVDGRPQRFQGHCTDVWFRLALEYIEQNRESERPFFCYIATNAPHEPFVVEDKYADLYRGRVPERRARFYGMITQIDTNFGLLRAKLAEWGLAENTILIFMTDNGTSAGAKVDDDGFVVDGFNAGMRGKKCSPYDGGHRVPFFLHWPGGGLDHGREVPELTSYVDFMPTILELCGLSAAAGEEGENGEHLSHHFHGRSLVPLLYGEGTKAFSDRILITDTQRLVNPVKGKDAAVMTRRWRLVRHSELYDILVDPEQRHNVADRYPEVVRELQAEYEKWWELVSARFAEEIPFVLKPGEETCLTCHDWRVNMESCPYHQGLIRRGLLVGGYWEVLVAEAGWYRVELRRWPRETGLPMRSGIEGSDVEFAASCVPVENHDYYTGGKALAVEKVKLKVGDKEYEQVVGESDAAAVFQIYLDEGPVHMQGRLTNQDGLDLGAYYAYIRSLA